MLGVLVLSGILDYDALFFYGDPTAPLRRRHNTYKACGDLYAVYPT